MYTITMLYAVMEWQESMYSGLLGTFTPGSLPVSQHLLNYGSSSWLSSGWSELLVAFAFSKPAEMKSQPVIERKE